MPCLKIRSEMRTSWMRKLLSILGMAVDASKFDAEVELITLMIGC